MAVTETLTYPEGAITVRLSPVPFRRYIDFVGKWSALIPYDEFVGLADDFVALAAPEWTFEGVARFEDLDFGIVRSTISTWIERVKEVPPPLPLGSSDTAPSPGPSTSRRSSHARRPSTTS